MTCPEISAIRCSRRGCWRGTSRHLGRGWWNANIFAPHPLALAYSEHFLPQALQVLADLRADEESDPLLQPAVPVDVRAVRARHVSARPRADRQRRRRLRRGPRVRVRAVSHRRTSRTCRCCRRRGCRSCCSDCGGISRPAAASAGRRGRGVAGAEPVVRLLPAVLQPDRLALHRVGADAAGTLARHASARARDRRDVAVFVVTVPFLLPYLELSRLGFSPRSLAETRRFSADVYGYLTADPNLRLWGPIAHAWPRSEGLLFPGVTIVVLARSRRCPFGRGAQAPGPSAGCRRSSMAARSSSRCCSAFRSGCRGSGSRASRARWPSRRSRGRVAGRRLTRRARRRAPVLAVARRHLFRDHDVRDRDVASARIFGPWDAPSRPPTCTHSSSTTCPASTASACRRASGRS